MKRISTLAIASLMVSCLMTFAQGTNRNVRNNHSVSMPLVGLEYSFEHGLGGSWSLIERAGLKSYYLSMHSDFEEFNITISTLPVVTIEPRYYTNMSRRRTLGKDTHNNSADFVSMPSTIFFTGDGVEFMISPIYGIRRCGGKHWTHEFSFGANVALGEFIGIMPHVQYRLGFSF